MQKRLLLGLCILLLGGLLISAVSALESGPHCCILEPQPPPWIWECWIDQFDPNLGILNAATIDMQSCEFLDLVLDSEDPSPLHLWVAHTGSTSTILPDGVIDELVFDPLQQDCYLAPDDELGDPDFAGPDSCKIDRDECKDDSRTYYASDLADYMGTGQVIFETSARSEWGIIGGGNVIIVDDSQIGHEICITYDYAVFGCLDVTKVIDKSSAIGDVPIPNFEICITRPYSTPNCQTANTNGQVLHWGGLIPGDYTVTETGPGANWAVAGSGEIVSVGPDGSCATKTITNTYQTTDPTDAVENAISAIKDLHLKIGIENSLISKLENTIKALNREDTVGAIDKLGAFINEVEAQRCKKIPCDDADELIAMVQQIIDSVGG